MPKVDRVGSPEGSDNDTVSITSTVPSEPREEYPLEGVLAERMNGGIKEFLVKWEGYPDERCTWETESNFQDDDTLHLWQVRKTRIARGLEKPYNVNALEARVEAWIAATKSRKARRRMKRRQLGLSIASKDTSEESSDGAEEVPHDSPRRAQSSRQGGSVKTSEAPGFIVDDEIEDEDDPQYSDADIRSGRKPKSNKPAADSSDEALTDDSLMEDLHTKALNEQHREVFRKPKPQGDQRVKKVSEKQPPKRIENKELPLKRHSTIPTADLPRKVATTSASHPSAAIKKRPKPEKSQMGTAGHGPARLSHKVSGSKARPKVSGAAVLGNWAAKVKPRKLSEPKLRKPSSSGQKPETFNRLSTKRRYEKAARNEPAPDPKHLTFVNLKAAKEAKTSIQLPSPPELAKVHEPIKTPYQLIQERLAREEEQRVVDDTNLASVTAKSDTPEPIGPAETAPPPTETVIPQYSTDSPQHSNDNSGSMMASKPAPNAAMSSEASLWDASQDLRGSLSPSLPAPDVPQPPLETSVSLESPDRRSSPLRSIAFLDATTVDIAPPSAPASFYSDGRVLDFSDVFATILIGPACQEVAQVRFRGLDKLSKRLLLSIKVPPRQMHVWFTHVCTAEDYRAFYHEVHFHSILSRAVTLRCLYRFRYQLTHGLVGRFAIFWSWSHRRFPTDNRSCGGDGGELKNPRCWRSFLR